MKSSGFFARALFAGMCLWAHHRTPRHAVLSSPRMKSANGEGSRHRPRSIRRKRRRHLAALAFIPSLVVLAIGPAIAVTPPDIDILVATANYTKICNVGSGGVGTTHGEVCKQADSAVDYYLSTSLSSASRGIVIDRINTQFNPTDLDFTLVSSFNQSTDDLYLVEPIDSQYTGYTYCAKVVYTSNHVCDSTHVAFPTGTSVGSHDACHETGHVVGLVHGKQASPSVSDTADTIGCMYTHGVEAGPDSLSPTLINNINYVYP
jgi:hypothetical protein